MRALLCPVDDATLAALDGGDEVDQRTAATARRAARLTEAFEAVGAHVWVQNLEVLAGEPVMLVSPPRPVRAHTHLHGWNTSVAEGLDHPAQVTRRLLARLEAGPPTAFLLPECRNIPPAGLEVTVRTDWSHLDDLSAALEESLGVLGVEPEALGERVLSAFSGGGRGLGACLQALPDGRGLGATKLELLDCLYAAPEGSWSARDAVQALASCEAGRAVTRVTYVHGDGGNGQRPDAALREAWGERLLEVEGGAHFATCADWLDGT
jgi:hypothetical protein